MKRGTEGSHRWWSPKVSYALSKGVDSFSGRILDSGREAKGRDTTLSKEVTFSVAVLLFISDRFITDGLHECPTNMRVEGNESPCALLSTSLS